ncbi:hypothetical protein [Streptomyces pacificus]|uniref:Uncharacterized protein n=1 Tax=Streptomyces pacificus TaxID=2705029 RepID=A0A6A0AR68_9ACTN|nr:hypothetical protein [Streptomyces pacificus]GFH35450.1 hypothetical protein SCWH03_16660 [Streptomyces pacificus]
MTDDLMTRARQAIEAEESARLDSKAEEIASADERARLQAEKEAKRQHARDTATQALNAPAVALGGVAKRFDAAVSALVALAEAAELRNRTIQQQAALVQAADVPENQGRGSNSVELGGRVHSVRDARPAELLARALAVAASEAATPDNGVKSLASDLLPHSGPLHRLTPVERAQR